MNKQQFLCFVHKQELFIESQFLYEQNQNGFIVEVDDSKFKHYELEREILRKLKRANPDMFARETVNMKFRFSKSIPADGHKKYKVYLENEGVMMPKAFWEV